MKYTYLYHLLDKEGRLLYIGISNGPIYRLFQHLEEKSWAPQIAWQHVERYNSRAEAEAAERANIKSLRPLYNIQFNNDSLAENVRNLNAKHRQSLFALFEANDVPKAADLTIANARDLARTKCGQVVNFSKEDWAAWCKSVRDRRIDLFEKFEQNRVPKDRYLSLKNARILAREMCGGIPNFSRADWDAWCDQIGHSTPEMVAK